jgi:serine/threonine protein kinase
MIETMTLQERVAAVLDPIKYSELTPLDLADQGMQRQTFTVKFGTGANKTTRIVKADKLVEGNTNVAFLAERGCGTRRELDLLGRLDVEEAIANGVSPLLNAYLSPDLAVTEEPLFEKSTTLKRMTTKKGRLSYREACDVFENVIKAAIFLKGKKIYHRDISPSNILVRHRGDDLESRLTDMANAAALDEVSNDLMPTAGGRLVRDPLLGTQFTGQPQAFTDKSEIYAIGISLAYALTGKAPFEYDFIEKKAVHTSEGVGNLLDSQGNLIHENHNRVLKNYLGQLKGRAKRFRSLLEKALTVNEGERFNTLEDFGYSFSSIASSSWRSLARNPDIVIKGGVIGALAMAVLGGGLVFLSNKKTDLEHRIEVAKALQYRVSAEWDGADRKIRNNAFNLSTHASNFSAHKPSPSYPEEVAFIRAKPGDKIYVSATLQALPLPKEVVNEVELRRYTGRVYLETYELDKENSFPLDVIVHPNDATKLYGNMYGNMFYGQTSGEIKLPENIPEGLYTIAVEMDSPENEKVPEPKTRIVAHGGVAKDPLSEEQIPKSHVYYVAQKGVLAREPIPVVVGNPSNIIDYSYLKVSGDDIRGGLINLGERENSPRERSYHVPREKFSYTFAIPKIDFIAHDEVKRDSPVIWLPKQNGTLSCNGHLIARDGLGNIINYTVIPLESYDYREKYASDKSNLTQVYLWRSGAFSSTSASDIAAERKQVEESLKAYNK